MNKEAFEAFPSKAVRNTLLIAYGVKFLDWMSIQHVNESFYVKRTPVTFLK